jgi:hypothetical protein
MSGSVSMLMEVGVPPHRDECGILAGSPVSFRATLGPIFMLSGRVLLNLLRRAST